MSASNWQDSYLEIGRVTKPHGIRGEIKIVLFAGVPVDLAGLRELRLLMPRDFKDIEIKKIRPGGRTAIVALAGVTQRDQAEGLVGAGLWVARESLPAPEADEFFWHELVGLDVFTESGRGLGRVVDLFATGAHDVLVLRGAGHEYMIPARREFLIEIDLRAGRVVVAPPPGLLEIYES